MTSQDLVEALIIIGSAVGALMVTVELLSVVFVTVILLKRGWLKMMPFRVKLTMVFFWVQNLYMLSLSLYFVLIESDWRKV